MNDQSEEKKVNKNGILIYKLPPENIKEILHYFQSDYILNYVFNKDGLHIYFQNPDLVVKYARVREIKVNGQFFSICLLVTNLTLHGIGTHTQDIKSLMELNGYKEIIDFYQVTEHGEFPICQSTIYLPDYRIILNIPEIFADFNLKRVRSHEDPNLIFDLSFFCRLCRKNGHKAFQCSEYTQASSSTDLTNRTMTDERVSETNHSLIFKSSLYSLKIKSNTKMNSSELLGSQADSKITRSQKTTSLSKGIREAILMTKGEVLPPDSFIRFLDQVRNRKVERFKEITFSFTKKVDRLISQLKSVKENYYRKAYKIRSTDEDRDIAWFKKLEERLSNLINSGNITQNETSNSNDQPCSSKILDKNSTSKFQSAGQTQVSKCQRRKPQRAGQRQVSEFQRRNPQRAGQTRVSEFQKRKPQRAGQIQVSKFSRRNFQSAGQIQVSNFQKRKFQRAGQTQVSKFQRRKF